MDTQQVGWTWLKKKILKLEDMSIETFQTDMQKERIKKIKR